MDKKSWIAVAIIFNLLMVTLYLASDYSLWMTLKDDLNGLTLAGEDSIKMVNSFYNVFSFKLAVTTLSNPFEMSYSEFVFYNFQFIIFAITIVVNLFMLIRMTKENIPKP